jgi:hypothetical protein
MKRLILALVLFTGIATFTALRSPAQEPVPQWSFVVTATDSGWTMTCDRGCAWERLRFQCQAKVPCKAQIGEDGVHLR